MGGIYILATGTGFLSGYLIRFVWPKNHYHLYLRCSRQKSNYDNSSYCVKI